jgi:hypothetical protein
LGASQQGSKGRKAGCIFTQGSVSTPNILSAWSDFTTSDSAAQVLKRHESSLQHSTHIRTSVQAGKFHETMAGKKRSSTIERHMKLRPNQTPTEHPLCEERERQKRLENQHTHNLVVSMSTIRALSRQNRASDAKLSRSLLTSQKRRVRKEMVLHYRDKELEHEYEDVQLDCTSPNSSFWESTVLHPQLPAAALIERGFTEACSSSTAYYRRPGIGQTTRGAFKLTS